MSNLVDRQRNLYAPRQLNLHEEIITNMPKFKGVSWFIYRI